MIQIKVKSPPKILNKAGKERRGIGKLLNLAATYGMGGATAGKRLGKSVEEGEKLLANFFNEFKGVKTAIDQSKAFLKEHGYVEDFIGRRRRLPEIFLPKYVVSLKNKNENLNFNPFIGCEDRAEQNYFVIKYQQKVNEAIKQFQKFRQELAIKEGKEFVDNGEMSNKAFDKLSKEALKEGVVIKANTGRIAQAERQCFNARIQGSAASLTKIAMIDIFNDEELRKRDTHLIITVHDEVLVECPAVYADYVEERLPQLMVNAAKEVGDDVPQACDPYNVYRWYSPEVSVAIQEEFKKLEKGDKDKNKAPMSRDDALEKVINNHTDIPREAIIKTIETGSELDF